MTVPNQSPRRVSIAAAGSTTFPYDFKVLTETDIEVQVNGVTKTLGVDYTVSGVGQELGGSIAFTAAMAGGETVMRRRNMPLARTNDFQYLGDLRSFTLNNDQDAPIMLIQQLNDAIGRALKLPLSATGTGDIGALVPLAPIVVTADGQGLESGSTTLTGDMLLRPNLADANVGSSIVAFRQLGSGAASRSVLDKLRETVSLKDFFQSSDGSDYLPAFNRAITYLGSIGGGRLYIPSGTYNVSARIDISGIDYLWIDGAGQDNTVIRTTSVTADVIYSNSDRKYRKFSNFTIGSTVTKTAGAHMYFLVERRSIISDVKLVDWFDGINLKGFEEVGLQRVKAVRPTGAGTCVSLGTKGVTGSGANVHLNECFLRGNDDVLQGPPVASWGIQAYDIDALFMVDTDIGGFTSGDLRVDPTVRAANFYFTSCFFDATKSSHCMLVTGTGTKQQWGLVNCWFASAGKLTGGSPDACGVFWDSQGAFSGVQFTGCRFYANSGAGFYQQRAGGIQIEGASFEQNGSPSGTYRYGYMYDPAAAVGPGPLLSGCRWDANLPKGVFLTGNAREVVIDGFTMDNGMDFGAAAIAHLSGFDKTSLVIASATNITIQPAHRYVVVTGTANIAGILATFAGHQVTIKFTGALTVIDNSQNLRLASNFTTAANSTLTLVCDGVEWQEVTRSNN